MINVETTCNKFDKYKLFMCDDFFFIVLLFQFREGLS